MILGIGVDLIEIGRIEEILRKHSGRFAEKIFTETERTYSDHMARPALHYAARFAAKEAFVKALGTGIAMGIHWKDVGVRNLPSGQPMLQIEGKALEVLRARGGGRVHVSLAHTHGHACATVVIEGAEGESE